MLSVGEGNDERRTQFTVQLRRNGCVMLEPME